MSNKLRSNDIHDVNGKLIVNSSGSGSSEIISEDLSSQVTVGGNDTFICTYPYSAILGVVFNGSFQQIGYTETDPSTGIFTMVGGNIPYAPSDLLGVVYIKA